MARVAMEEQIRLRVSRELRLLVEDEADRRKVSYSDVARDALMRRYGLDGHGLLPPLGSTSTRVDP